MFCVYTAKCRPSYPLCVHVCRCERQAAAATAHTLTLANFSPMKGSGSSPPCENYTHPEIKERPVALSALSGKLLAVLGLLTRMRWRSLGIAGTRGAACSAGLAMDHTRVLAVSWLLPLPAREV